MKIIKKIVLTGGPCSGKTTFTSRARQILEERGYRVIIANESATDLISGGISPATLNMYKFQKYCIDLQLKKEELAYKAAKEIEGDKVVIIIDRGIPDDEAYVGEEQFKEILKEFNLDIKDLNSRYDLVIHLVTAAKGKEEAYTLANNAARYESKEQAITMDDQALEAYKNHPNRIVISNETDFEEKMRNSIQAILQYLGDNKSEIFKKYLVEVDQNVLNEIAKQSNYMTSHIYQLYLQNINSTERRIRKRVRGDDVLYSYSEATYMSNNERIKTDRILSSREYFDYMPQVNKDLKPIDKIRHSFIEDEHFYKLDIFDFDTTKGLLSLQTSDNDITLPSYFKVVKEVSDDCNYKNYFLALNSHF